MRVGASGQSGGGQSDDGLDRQIGGGRTGGAHAAQVWQLPLTELGSLTRRGLSRAGITEVLIFSIPLTSRFRQIDNRNGLLFRGPGGWAECAPFWNYAPPQAAPWVAGAIDVARRGLPPAAAETVGGGRGGASLEVNAIIPMANPQTCAALAQAAGANTVKIKVAEPGVSLQTDCERLQSVRAALGPQAHLRLDANGAWSLSQARVAIEILAQAAGGVQYVEQPTQTLTDLLELQDEFPHIALAADEAIRLAPDPFAAASTPGIRIAILKAMPLGGPWRAARVGARVRGGQVVVSSALDTSVGLVAGVALAQAVGTTLACGLATGSLLSADVVDPKQALMARAGRLAVHHLEREIPGEAGSRLDTEIFRILTAQDETGKTLSYLNSSCPQSLARLAEKWIWRLEEMFMCPVLMALLDEQPVR